MFSAAAVWGEGWGGLSLSGGGGAYLSGLPTLRVVLVALPVHNQKPPDRQGCNAGGH